MEENLSDEVKAVENLAEVTIYVPKSAYTGRQGALQHECSLIQSNAPTIGDLFSKLESIIKYLFHTRFGEDLSP